MAPSSAVASKNWDPWCATKRSVTYKHVLIALVVHIFSALFAVSHFGQ
jgi:hypothetical protein